MNNPRRLLIATLVVLTPLQPALQAASNNPTGGKFVAGSGKISSSGNTLTVDQNSLKGIIDWNTFSIGQGSTVDFINGSGSTLNKVTGSTPTTILGQLLATGNIYLLNPEGVLIGHGSSIHTGGDFLASTLNLPNSSFLNNNFQFSGVSNATVVNLGDITSTGGNIYLIGHSVQNAGSLSTSNGTTGLAAGSQVLITDSATAQKVSVQAPGGDVTNSGFISAAQAELKSNGGNIYALAGNNGGQINATGTVTQDGHVWLVATNGTTNVSGVISAINANGTGGDIETSGAHVSTNGAQIKTGSRGNWLLDPDDLTINSTLAGTIESTLNGGTNVTEQTTASGTGGSGDITVASNIAWTTNANLTLSAYRNIDINSVVVISNTASGNLTLRADNTANGTGTITFADNTAKIDFSNSLGNVSLLYNPSSYASPTDYSANILTNSSWSAPDNASVSTQSTAYMLVNSAADLQNLDQNDAGTYALGTNIDLSSIANFTPLGNSTQFSGILDGMGQSVSNLTITSSSGNSGIFSQVGSSGIVRNLNLVNASISASAASEGTLVGANSGKVANVTTWGALAASGSPEELGGLVGYNTGTILNSSSSVSVDATHVTPLGVGGLAGFNSGSVASSYASGSVSSASSNSCGECFFGGLIGYNPNGTVSKSYATGAVNFLTTSTSCLDCIAGGLIGYDPNGHVTASYETGAVYGPGRVGGLIGIQVSGSLSDSYATDAVSAGPNSWVGGLIGQAENTTVSTSFATGTVSHVSGSYIGGVAALSLNDTFSSVYWDTLQRVSPPPLVLALVTPVLRLEKSPRSSKLAHCPPVSTHPSGPHLPVPTHFLHGREQ